MLRVVAVVLVLLGTTARADVFDHARDDVAMSQEASRLFDEGREAAKRGDYAGACALFSRSLQIERALGTQLNYADCLEQTNQLRRAYELFGEIEPRARERGQLERAQLAKDRGKALELRLATIVVELNDPTAQDLVVVIDNRSVRVQERIIERTDPGTIDVTVATSLGRHTQKVALLGGVVTTVVIPRIERVAALEEPFEPGYPRAELALGSLLAGIHVGVRLCELSVDDCSDTGAPVFAAGGLFATSLILGRNLEVAQVQIYNSTQLWAVWNSFFLLDGVDWGRKEEAALALGAHAVGFGSGLALWRLWRPSPGDVALTNSFFVWGTALTFLGYNVIGDREDALPAVLVGDGALLVGALLSTQVELTRSQLLVIDLGGALGLAMGGLLLNTITDNPTSQSVGAGFLGGAVAGLGIVSLIVWKTNTGPAATTVTLTPTHNGVGLSGTF